PVRGAENRGAPKPIQQLEVFPAKVRLFGPEATQRLVVLGVAADHSRRDITAEARLSASSPGRLTIAPDGTIQPQADGMDELVVQAGLASARIPVEVSGVSWPRKVSFRNEIEPRLTKLGCNQGACHGSQHGKGGFKLSLLGFEPDADYTAIVKSA